MTDAGWAEKVIEKAQRLKSPDDQFVRLPEYLVVRLLKAEHARAVRICRQAKMLKFHGLRDTDTNEWLDGYEAACDDMLTALQRGRGGKG